MYNGEDIKMQREAIANQIVKGFSNSDDLLEKAHNHGDVHPNGKWYWESSANGGKGDWRTIKASKTATTKQKSEKTDDATKNVPYTNLKSADDAISYAKTLSDFTFNDEESGWGKGGKAFSLTNKNGLKMTVDFLDNTEYVYNFEDKDGNRLYSISSTVENYYTDWKKMLNPKTWSASRMSTIKSNISKYETASKRAKTSWNRYGKYSDWKKYVDNKNWAESARRRLENVKKIASLS